MGGGGGITGKKILLLDENICSGYSLEAPLSLWCCQTNAHDSSIRICYTCSLCAGGFIGDPCFI